MEDSINNDTKMLRTLILKQTATKLKENSPKVKPEPAQKQTEDNSFYNEFEACLSELKVKNRAKDRTVDIIDKVSSDEIMRKYNHDFGKYFRPTEKTKKGLARRKQNIQKTIKKILENPGLDADQRIAMQEYCKSFDEITHNNFQCDLCDEDPMNKRQLEMHKLKHHVNFEKECCGKRYVYFKSYTLHVRECHNLFQCEFCEERLLNRVEKAMHKDTVHYGKETSTTNKQTEFKCSFCGKTFKDRGNHKRHIRQVHTDLKPYKCKECGRDFSDAGNLKRHIKHKHEGVRQQCPQCSQTVVFSTLKRHIQSFHTKETMQCPHCELDFRSKYGLNSHVNEKHKAVPIEYMCEICGEGNLFSPQSRMRHKTIKHPKEFEEKKNLKRQNEANKIPHYECSYCGKDFPKRLERDRHQNSEHKDNNSTKWKCSCGVTAITEKRLLYHKENTCTLKAKIRHSETVKPFLHPKQFTCRQCDKLFKSLKGYQRHIQSVHEGVRKECPHCKKSLSLGNINQHIKKKHHIK